MTINNATTWALSVFDSDLSSTQKLICLYLRTHMNDYRDCAWPAVARIAAKCNLTERAVYKNLPLICEAGYLIANGHGPKGTIRYEIGTPERGTTERGTPERGSPERGSPLNVVHNTPERSSPELTKELTNTLSIGKATKFVRPTVDQVRDYCLEKGYTIDPETFVNYYNSNGWKVGRASMKCWKSACTNWQKRESKNANTKQHHESSRKLSGAEKTRRAREAARARDAAR